MTAVDTAIRAVPDLPAPPPGVDETRVPALRTTWDILPGGPPPVDGSLRGRLRALVWQLVGPPLDAQRRFNQTVAEHLDRNLAGERATRLAVAALVDAVRRELAALAGFESTLVQYLQTITAFIETKDRSLGGDEIRERLSLTEQRLVALKRDLERLAHTAPAAAGTPAVPAAEAFQGSLDAPTYVGFQDRVRGSQDEIRARVDAYLPLLATAADVVDIGCGRGELVEQLKAAGVRARGVDVNPAMVELCRSRGLDVEQGEAVSWLQRQADGSLGGLVAIQVVEHLEPARLLRFLETAYLKMRQGAPLVLETINPACWLAFFECYIRDLTHQRPLHPETLRYLVQAAGFTSVDVHYREPVREEDRLARASHPTAATAAGLAELVTALNDHADKLNARLFSYTDYAIVARR